MSKISLLWRWPFITWLTHECNISHHSKQLLVMALPSSCGDFDKPCQLFGDVWMSVWGVVSWEWYWKTLEVWWNVWRTLFPCSVEDVRLHVCFLEIWIWRQKPAHLLQCENTKVWMLGQYLLDLLQLEHYGGDVAPLLSASLHTAESFEVVSCSTALIPLPLYSLPVAVVSVHSTAVPSVLMTSEVLTCHVIQHWLSFCHKDPLYGAQKWGSEQWMSKNCPLVLLICVHCAFVGNDLWYGKHAGQRQLR